MMSSEHKHSTKLLNVLTSSGNTLRTDLSSEWFNLQYHFIFEYMYEDSMHVINMNLVNININKWKLTFVIFYQNILVNTKNGLYKEVFQDQ